MHTKFPTRFISIKTFQFVHISPLHPSTLPSWHLDPLLGRPPAQQPVCAEPDDHREARQRPQVGRQRIGRHLVPGRLRVGDGGVGQVPVRVRRVLCRVWVLGVGCCVSARPSRRRLTRVGQSSAAPPPRPSVCCTHLVDGHPPDGVADEGDVREELADAARGVEVVERACPVLLCVVCCVFGVCESRKGREPKAREVRPSHPNEE